LGAYAALCVMWSSTWVWMKIGLDHGLEALTGAGLRFILAGVIFTAWCLIRNQSLRLRPGEPAFVLIISLLFIAVPFGLVYVAETQVTSGITAVLFGSMPLFTALAADRVLPDEPLSIKRLAGIGVGIGGLAITFSGAFSLHSGVLVAAAIAGIIVAAALSGLSDVLMKHRDGTVIWSVILAWTTTLGGVYLFGFGLLVEPDRIVLVPETVASLAYLAIIGTVISFGLFFWLLHRLSAVEMSLQTLLVPILALVWGSGLYGEPLTITIALGSIPPETFGSIQSLSAMLQQLAA